MAKALNILESQLHQLLEDDDKYDTSQRLRALNAWGALNGLKQGAPFGPRKLAGWNVRSGKFGSGEADDMFASWPGRDHDTAFKRGRQPAAIVTEPYGDPLDELRNYVDPLGLVVHHPPNPRAGFWNPGSTLFLVITKPDFGEVKWLEEQLKFDRDLFKEWSA